MSIVDTGKLLVDLRAVLASVTTKEIEVLKDIRLILDERYNELMEDIKNGY